MGLEGCARGPGGAPQPAVAAHARLTPAPMDSRKGGGGAAEGGGEEPRRGRGAVRSAADGGVAAGVSDSGWLTPLSPS